MGWRQEQLDPGHKKCHEELVSPSASWASPLHWLSHQGSPDAGKMAHGNLVPMFLSQCVFSFPAVSRDDHACSHGLIWNVTLGLSLNGSPWPRE